MEFSDSNHKLQNYLEAYVSPEEEILGELSRYTFLKVGHPNMLSGPVQGKFLEFVSKMINPERILEIGTFTGYSAICLARGLKKGGKLITLEVNDELRSKALEFFDLAGLSDSIEIINGNALEISPSLNDIFDLIFIDGEKVEYSNY
jgi:predicted O-methyltransferase YrrM